jgi:hypothetical protein
VCGCVGCIVHGCASCGWRPPRWIFEGGAGVALSSRRLCGGQGLDSVCIMFRVLVGAKVGSHPT